MLEKIANVVGKVAPLLASALGSPLAGVAVSLIANAFGVKSDSATEILSAINNDPDSSVKLKQIELEHEAELAKIASIDFQTEVDDRKDSRKSAIQGNYDWFVHIISVCVLSAFFYSIHMLFTTTADQSDHDILYMMLGMLGTSFVQVCSWYYGRVKGFNVMPEKV